MLKKIFKLENLVVLILIFSCVIIQLRQAENWEDYSGGGFYIYDDSITEAYLYLREYISKNSKILTPNFSDDNDDLINNILYDMDLIESPFNILTTYKEFELFIIYEEIDYLLLENSGFNLNFYLNFSVQYHYELLFENEMYEIYKVHDKFNFIPINPSI